MYNKFNQFKLLMWKNWILAARSPCKFVLEIFIPILLFVMLATRLTIRFKNIPAKNFKPFRANDTNTLCINNTSIAVSPQSKIIDKVVKRILIDCPGITFTSYKDTQNLEKGVQLNNFDAAIQLDDSLKNMSKLPSDLKVTIRMKSGEGEDAWLTDQIYLPGLGRKSRELDKKTGGEPYYQERGFLLLQQLTTLAFVNYNKSEKLNIMMRRYPYPLYEFDLIYTAVGWIIMPVATVLSFILTYHSLVTAITTEKEQQLKESMKVMGLSGWLQWLAWFMRGFIILFIIIAVIVMLLKGYIIGKPAVIPVFGKTDGTLLFFILLLYACSLITFAFLVSVFFSKASTASIVGSIVFIFSWVPYCFFIFEFYKKTTGAYILPNSAVSFAMLIMIINEDAGEGTHWSTLWKPAPENDLILGPVMLMLIFDIFLYLIIALYVEAIFPGKFGIPKPWYFPVQRFLCKRNKIKHVTDDESKTSKNEEEFFEKFTENIPKGIQLKNLSKSFRGHSAVKNVSLDVYEGHITVLMGHNGAGKTTIISMITGMFPPTRGTVIVNGYDVRTDVEHARKSMGLCLQHNVLINDLTVEEHLYFFSKLKGLKENEVDAEINKYLKLLEFEDKKNERSKNLSGGMKRKLSVALAFCGKSKIVVLDEPTSGLDPSARRVVWNMIVKEKRERTILLTTHSMDEADIWGDRIAIMAAGTLHCCGSSFFLKKKYHVGYFLIMEISPKCVTQSVTNLLRFYVPQIKIHSRVGTELTYQLPESETLKFEKMLRELESRSSALGILSYGISFATLEQVFLKIGADQGNMISVTQIEDIRVLENLKGYRLICNQCFAMFLKKWLYSLRNWHLYLFQIIVFIVLFFPVDETKVFYETEDALKLTLDQYRNPVTLISGNKNNPLYINYKRVLSGQGKILEVTNISKTIPNLWKKFPYVVKSSYVVGASFNDNVTTAWFNGHPYHSSPLALGLVLNAIYSHHLGLEKTITFVNHPLPLNFESKVKQSHELGSDIMYILGFLLTFIVSFYVLHYIKERISKSKHLQYVSGMNVYVFWITAFIFDLIIFTITIILMLMIILITGYVKEAIKHDSKEENHDSGIALPAELVELLLLFYSFGFFVLPFLYVFSHICSTPAQGFLAILLIGLFIGVGGGYITYELQSALKYSDIAVKNLNYVWMILMFIPFYMVCKSISDVFTIAFTELSCSEYATPEEYCKVANVTQCCDIKDFFSMEFPGAGYNILISFIMFVVLFIIIFIVDEFDYLCTCTPNKLFRKKKLLPVETTDLDNDVNEEKQKIKTTPKDVLNAQYCLVLRDVTKYYKKFLAVNGLCLGVKSFECFGLLGINGAGKTTTFKMLTGDTRFSYGDAWTKGFSTKTQRKRVRQLIGYCPQFDALLDHLTPRETMKIFALIRGIPREKCKEVGEELARKLDFHDHIDKQIKHLSGGTKRKLSLALAVIGNPPLIYLDEPTTGVDPISKSRIWNYLRELRDQGSCIILTSHSMEECEHLCTRLVIMVNGNFRCLGSVQHIKNKFAQGYFLTVKMKKSDSGDYVAVIDKFIKQYFPGAELKERYQEVLNYQLPISSMPWSQIFGLFESHKKQLNIQDYSIEQCSLDQVFFSFTKSQKQNLNSNLP